jgi:hypothetical protein
VAVPQRKSDGKYIVASATALPPPNNTSAWFQADTRGRRYYSVPAHNEKIGYCLVN